MVIFRKRELLGHYYGLRREAHATGEYVLSVDRSVARSLPEGGDFTIDAGGSFGSIFRYCNGVADAGDALCNVQAHATYRHPLRPLLPNGRASIPVVAWRPLHPHQELIISYGREFCKTIPDFALYKPSKKAP